MNYQRILALLALRYARRTKCGVVRCADCGGRMDEHEMWCRCYHYAKQITRRALREMGRTA